VDVLATIFVKTWPPATATGTSTAPLPVPPSPSCAAIPQHQAAPAAVSPQLWTSLLAMPAKACTPPTASGTDAASSWPSSLLPQHQVAPAVQVMQVCQLPMGIVAKVDLKSKYLPSRASVGCRRF